ncbi:phospholipase A2-like [Pagrus major]|uniref:Phospholipase A2 n=1 Tax=Pagrus major TaxID=143350 RepID=Q9DEB0_PAGMA|nr:phospholipase A2 [Pagrus major]
MNVSGPLLMLLLTACTVSGERRARAIWQFGDMIECVQPGVDPINYNNYGCYCGLGGKGTPVDDLDRCCKVHDDCYGAQMEIPECSGFFDKPYFIIYDYTCSERKVTCSATNNKCQKAACECDRAAAHCFARVKYNPEHKNLDQKLCEK